MRRYNKVREFIKDIAYENLGKRLVNSREGAVEFELPVLTLEILLSYGKMIENEQENVKRVQLADAYLDGAVLAGRGLHSSTFQLNLSRF